MILCIQISDPDEFDVMLPIPVDRVAIEPFGEDGAFYSVALKRGNRTLQKFQETNALSASKMLEEFREEVKKSVKGFKGEYQNDYFSVAGFKSWVWAIAVVATPQRSFKMMLNVHTE